MSPLVSAVLPTCNRAARLGGAVESVLAQTVSDLELIVVDNGSSDGTGELLARASERDRRVRAVRLDARSGPSAARNVGIREASGELLAFIDDDDRWTPDKTAVQLEALRADPGLGAVTCHYSSVDEPSGRRAPFRGPTRYPAAALLWSNFPACYLGLVRRSAYSSDIRFDESLTTCEDWDLWLRCARECGIATVPRVLADVVAHAEQSFFDAERSLEGRARFVAKHEAAMDARCRRYHEARLELMRAGTLPNRLRLHAAFLARLPRGIRGILAVEASSARLGRLIGDPGLGLRALLRLVERLV